ncbi:MAG: thiol:disulfide interchange protein DsbA/DsbL [Burkholderiales bacterium]|nr:thiol:disulfide interchange protein DsbA/DsbL [Burkholderiales bacterium]
MNTLRALCLGIAVWTLGFAPGVHAQAAGSFTEISPRVPAPAGNRVEVVEFFYYGCPVCYELQPQLARWLAQASDQVALRRVPALSVENLQSWERLAKLYYSLEALGQMPRLHWPVYDNLHFDGVDLGDEKVMLDWVSRNGVDRGKFFALYHAPQITRKVEESRALMKAYGARGVPTIVVDGRYLSSARMANGTRQLVQVVEQLVARARRERP